MPLIAGGNPGVEVSTIGRTADAVGSAPTPLGSPARPSASSPNVAIQFRNRAMSLDPLATSGTRTGPCRETVSFRTSSPRLALLRLPWQYCYVWSVRTAIVGGGPGGLFAATLL